MTALAFTNDNKLVRYLFDCRVMAFNEKCVLEALQVTPIIDDST